jgi:hypothetical protein
VVTQAQRRRGLDELRAVGPDVHVRHFQRCRDPGPSSRRATGLALINPGDWRNLNRSRAGREGGVLALSLTGSPVADLTRPGFAMRICGCGQVPAVRLANSSYGPDQRDRRPGRQVAPTMPWPRPGAMFAAMRQAEEPPWQRRHSDTPVFSGLSRVQSRLGRLLRVFPVRCQHADLMLDPSGPTGTFA